MPGIEKVLIIVIQQITVFIEWINECPKKNREIVMGTKEEGNKTFSNNEDHASYEIVHWISRTTTKKKKKKNSLHSLQCSLSWYSRIKDKIKILNPKAKSGQLQKKN